MNYKRAYRDFKENLGKNIGFFLLITLGVMVIVSFNRAMDSCILTVEDYYESKRVEDGRFGLVNKLSNQQIAILSSRFAAEIEEMPCVDVNLTENDRNRLAPDVILRLFSLKRSINQAVLLSGCWPEQFDEVLLDPKFAETHGYTAGDNLTLNQKNYTVVGTAVSPDYTYTLKITSDMMNSPETFGIAFLPEKGFSKLDDAKNMINTYSFICREDNIMALQDYLKKNYDLTEFLARADNSRIQTFFNDANAPKQVSLLMGVMLIALISLVISISVRSHINAESQTIGILYAQGFKPIELIKYYLLLPGLLSATASICGYGLGVFLSRYLTVMQEEQYSYPEVIMSDSFYLLALGLALPILLSLGITYWNVKKTLLNTPLSLLRNQYAEQSLTTWEQKISGHRFSFMTRFRIKEMLRERSNLLAMFMGVSLAMFILFTALFLNDSITKYMESLVPGIPFNNMYTFINEADLHKYAQRGELTAIKEVKLFAQGKERNLKVQGLKPDSEFFSITGLSNLQSDEVLLSPTLHWKFRLNVGDSLTLHDLAADKKYAVVVKGMTTYDYGPYMYTNLETYNQIFRLHQNSVNTLMTNEKLVITHDKIYSLTEKPVILSSVHSLLKMVSTLSNIMIAVALIILITVIYMLMNMVIAKKRINISLVKIFGYSPQEINHLYTRGNFIFLFCAFWLAIPCSYIVTKLVYDSILENMEPYFMPAINYSSIFLAAGIMSLGYFTASYFIKKSLDQVPLTEAIKNRE